VDGGVAFVVKETGESTYTTFSNGYFDMDCYTSLNYKTSRFTIGIITNTSTKMGYIQVGLGTGSYVADTQTCSVKTWHFAGKAVDSTGVAIDSGNLTVTVEGESAVNRTMFTDGNWDIYLPACLITGKLYTFRFTLSSGNKNAYMLLKQIAK
jgi:hypothetical protein